MQPAPPPHRPGMAWGPKVPAGARPCYGLAMRRTFLALVLAAMLAPGPAAASLAWIDLADITVASPVILRAKVDRARRLGPRVAPDVAPGRQRLLVAARLVSALRTPGLVPARAEWLWEGEPSAAPRKGTELIAFLVPAGPGPRPELAQYRLVAAHGQVPWDPGTEARVRAILRDLAGWTTAPEVEAVRSGFHVPGTLEGESESQIFLALKGGTPITLVVLRRPGALPEIRVATGDLIDESAAPVEPETLLWRALACGLPREAPEPLAADPALARDYVAVRAALGPCTRRSPAATDAARSR